jgi:hypothetical protein
MVSSVDPGLSVLPARLAPTTKFAGHSAGDAMHFPLLLLVCQRSSQDPAKAWHGCPSAQSSDAQPKVTHTSITA